MAVRQVNVGAIEIYNVPGLDQIDVFWKDTRPGVGSVTITCYGCAWTAWFGAMNGNTIGEFFAGADTDYLVTKLGIAESLKSRKRDDVYLAKIINAIKAEIKEAK